MKTDGNVVAVIASSFYTVRDVITFPPNFDWLRDVFEMPTD